VAHTRVRPAEPLLPHSVSSFCARTREHPLAFEPVQLATNIPYSAIRLSSKSKPVTGISDFATSPTIPIYFELCTLWQGVEACENYRASSGVQSNIRVESYTGGVQEAVAIRRLRSVGWGCGRLGDFEASETKRVHIVVVVSDTVGL
jgi:hypothetical protein